MIHFFTLVFSHCSSSTTNTTVKRLLLPPEFFQFISDVPGKQAGYYKCTFPGCKPKMDKNGQEKYLVVYNVTRGNGKRHFCVSYLLPLCNGTCTITIVFLQDHDPNGELNHHKKWKDALNAMKAQQSVQLPNSNCTQAILKKVVITQHDLNDWVLVCASIFPINNLLN